MIVVDEYLAMRSLTGVLPADLPDEPIAVDIGALADPLANSRAGYRSVVTGVAGVVAS